MVSTDRQDPPTGAPPSDLPDAGRATKRPRRRVVLLGVTAAIVLAADVISKAVAVATLSAAHPVKLLGGAVYLVLYRNPGAAFSLAEGATWVLSLIAIGVVLAIIAFARTVRSPGWAVGLGLVLGGAAGNLTDRLVRPPGPLRGYVIDFLSLFAPDGSVWPVFNLADTAIVCGGVLLVVLTLLGHDHDGGGRGRGVGR